MRQLDAPERAIFGLPDKAQTISYQNRLRARAQTIFNTKPAPHIRALYAKKVDFDVGGRIGNFSHPAATHN
jgi:hypothetical protein